MKIKLYSARELDKKFPSGKWNGIEIIDRRASDKYWWRYYRVIRNEYKRIARRYRKAELWFNGMDSLKRYHVIVHGLDYAFPEIFVKKVK